MMKAGEMKVSAVVDVQIETEEQYHAGQQRLLESHQQAQELHKYMEKLSAALIAYEHRVAQEK